MYNIDAVQAMAFDGCYHDSSETDVDQTSFSLQSEDDSMRAKYTGSPCTDLSRIKRKSTGGNVGRIILENNHAIDTYSRIVFPIVYIIFNFFYWGLYV